MVRQSSTKTKRASKGNSQTARPPGRQGGKWSGPADLMTLSDLEQVRVLADPLRIRILEELGEERTTKQVADAIGEKPTKLYHHVEALERVGLIRLTRTRRNRGTLERYYQVVALCFRTDPGLFPRTGATDTAMEVISNLLARTGTELQELAASGHDAIARGEAILTVVEVRAPGREIAEIRGKLETLLKDLQALAARDFGDSETQRYRLVLGYYPLVKAPPPNG